MSFVDELKWSFKWGAIVGGPSVAQMAYGVWQKAEYGNLPWSIQLNVVIMIAVFVSIVLFFFGGALRFLQAWLVALMLKVDPSLKRKLAKFGVALWWLGLYTDGSSTLNND